MSDNSLHDSNIRRMQLIDYLLRRHPDGTNKKSGFALDDDINQLRKLTIGVVILQMMFQSDALDLWGGYAYVGFPGASSHLGKK